MKHPVLLVILAGAVGLTAIASLRAEEPEKAPGSAPSTVPAPAAMPGPKVGDKAPDAQVALPSGNPVQLTEVYAKGPIVLIFYRGGWCPYCNKNLAGWDEQLHRTALYGATVMAITPETPQFIEQTTTQQKLRFGILSDYKGEAASKFGIGFELPEEMQAKYREYGVDLTQHNWDKSWRLPHPAAYVIDRDGTIRYAYCNEDYKVRADPAEVLKVLKQMSEEREAAAAAAKKK